MSKAPISHAPASQAPVSYSWFSFPFFAPLSGAVTQDIAPQIYQGSYQGVPEIEVAVIREAGSFGTQLGALTKAVLELAARVDPAFSGTRGQALAAETGRERTPLEDLAALDGLIDDIKKRHRDAAEREARRALERLRTVDAAGYGRLAAEIGG